MTEEVGPPAQDEGIAALVAASVSMTFSGIPALVSLDLTIHAGEVHALLGENGSGKSTFIKILSGYHVPDPGADITIFGQPLSFGVAERSYAAGCRFVHQDLGLVDASSILDNLCLNAGFPTRFGTVREGAARRDARADLDRVGIHLDPRLPVAELSPAMKTGVAVARAIRPDDSSPVHLLVLDEPTATLPSDEVARLQEIVRRVARSGVGVLYVTHRLDEIFDLADNVSVLRSGRKVATRRTRDLDRRALVNLLVGREFDETHDFSVAAAGSAAHPDCVLEVNDITAGVLDGVTFKAHAGEIIGIAGIVGSGREALLASIFGAVPRSGGELQVSGDHLPPMQPSASIELGLAYLPPDRKTSGGLMELTARENLTLVDLGPFWRRGWLRRKLESAEARKWIDRLSVRPSSSAELPLRSFSGGNQQRILFGKWLRSGPKVFLLDEPTQGVDVEAKAQLHHQLILAAQGGMAVIVSSADLDELVALCQRVIVLRNGKITAILDQGNTTVAQLAAECLESRTDVAV